MGCPDRMGAFTNRRRRVSFESRIRLISPARDYSEFAHRNKRFRLQQEKSSFSCPSFIEDGRFCRSESKGIAKLNYILPPPSPLKRTVQGPERRADFLKTRVSELSVLEKQLEQEWTMSQRIYNTCDFESLVSYKKRIDELRTKIVHVNASYLGGESTEVVIQEEGVGVGVDSDRSGITIEDERVEVGTYSGGIENRGEEIAIDNGPPSFTPVVIHDVEMNTERESESENGRKMSEQTKKVEPPLYKKLLEKTKERDFKLKFLEMETEMATAKFEGLHVSNLKYKQKQDGNEIFIEPEKEHKLLQVALRNALAPLEDEDEADVAVAFKGPKRQEVLVMHESSNIEITRQTLQCLMPGAWLNDEVINLYFELLKEREKRNPETFLKCHFFNTFFYKKLFNKANYDYKAVRRWTTPRKIGYSLIDCDKIFVPIHKEIHWCLAIIDIRAKKFQYLDSLKGTDTRVLQVLAKYIVDEAKDKKDQDLNVSDWDKEFVQNLPAQENGWDCGVFMIKYADFHSQDLPLSFSQADMPYFRKRTAKEILGLRAE